MNAVQDGTQAQGPNFRFDGDELLVLSEIRAGLVPTSRSGLGALEQRGIIEGGAGETLYSIVSPATAELIESLGSADLFLEVVMTNAHGARRCVLALVESIVLVFTPGTDSSFEIEIFDVRDMLAVIEAWLGPDVVDEPISAAALHVDGCLLNKLIAALKDSDQDPVAIMRASNPEENLDSSIRDFLAAIRSKESVGTVAILKPVGFGIGSTAIVESVASISEAVMMTWVEGGSRGRWIVPTPDPSDSTQCWVVPVSVPALLASIGILLKSCGWSNAYELRVPVGV